MKPQIISSSNIPNAPSRFSTLLIIEGLKISNNRNMINAKIMFVKLFEGINNKAIHIPKTSSMTIC